MRSRRCWTVLVLFTLSAGALLATTWAPIEVECPICHTKNSFNEIMSYGSYIYGWPSKFQIIYWPNTTANVVYTCKRCNYSAFMWDFRNPPPDKIEDIRHSLRNITVDTHERYTDIPMSKRLEIAEKVYSVLDKGDEFWCHFYRVEAYHLAREKRTEEATQARRKALEIARRMLDNSANSGRRKELLLISGAMHHFLYDDVAAKADLESSITDEYDAAKLTVEQKKNVNDNMSSFAREYLDLLAKNKVPKDDGTDPK